MVSGRTVIVDCGASRTACGVFSRHGRRLRLSQYAAEYFPDQAGNEDRWLENTRVALQVLRRRVPAGGPVGLVLPAHLTLTKAIKTPRIGPAQREKIVRFEAEQNIPYALSDVVWDSVVVGETDLEWELLLAAAKLDAVEPLCDAAAAAGFEPRLVLPSALATLAGFRLVRPAGTESALVLNLGARSTTLLLVEARRFAVRTFLLGGPSDSQPQAGNPQGRIEATDPGRPERLAQEIARSVLHFHWRSKMGNPGRVYLTGGGARRPGLDGILAEKLKIPVGRFEVQGVLEFANDTVRSHAIVPAAMLTDLVGAAAIQLRSNQPVLNLLPPRRQQKENFRRRQPWLMAAAVLAVAALLLPAVHFHRLTNEVQKKSVAIERELTPLRAREQRVRTKLARLTELTQQIARFHEMDDRRRSWLNLLADLQDRLTRVEDVWLEKLQVVPAIAGAPLRLAVTGCLLDKAHPLAPASPGPHHRVQALWASLMDSPFVAAVEGGRFDSNQPGILRFDFVLVTGSQPPL